MSSTTVIDNFDKQPLRYDDAELREITRDCSAEVIDYVPGFRYWEMDARARKMDHPDNLTGYQQRAFDFYWTIRHGTQRGKIFLGLGTSNTIPPSSLGTDKFCGVPPHASYGPEYGYPHLRADADEELPFFTGVFAGVTANHVFEHLGCQEKALREMFRVTASGGYICMVLPDMTYMEKGTIDPTHHREFTADEFWAWMTGLKLPNYEVIEFNTFDNGFSFNVVLRAHTLALVKNAQDAAGTAQDVSVGDSIMNAEKIAPGSVQA